jgi:hypothetical protein
LGWAVTVTPPIVNGSPGTTARTSKVAPRFLSVYSGEKFGFICPSRMPSSIAELRP